MYIVGCYNFTKTSKNNDTNCLSETSRKTLSMALVQCTLITLVHLDMKMYVNLSEINFK